MLGGLLADLSAEHYHWVATGDKANPDASTVQERANTFSARITSLFTDGMIWTLPNTFTGVTLAFLKEAHYYQCGTKVFTMSIGDWRTETKARQTLRVALGRVKVVVANIMEYLKLYRPDYSWLAAFTGFRLPSPLSALEGAASVASTEVIASLRRICKEAKLPENKTLQEFRLLLPRAEYFHRRGCHPREAWGRAALEWHECQSGRRLVELFLVWKTSSGNLERRFRRFREIRCPQRARLMDLSVEDCMLVEQAPTSKMLCSISDAGGGLPVVKHDYIKRVLKWHGRLHGNGSTRIRRVERRDAGVQRGPVSGRLGPETEAAFGRKREAAIADVAVAPDLKRRHMIKNAPYGLELVAGSAGDSHAVACPEVISKVARREPGIKEGFVRGAEQAAKARAVREERVVRSSTQPRQGRDEDLEPERTPGIMLVRVQDKKARRKAEKNRFQLISDPLEFVAKAIKVPASMQKGHVVIAPNDYSSDYAVSARIAAAFMGAFVATPTDYDRSSPQGIMYREMYKRSKQSFHVAVSDALAVELPTLPQLLRAISQAPASCCELYQSERQLYKFFKKTVKKKPLIQKRIFVLSKLDDALIAEQKYRVLHFTPRSFLLNFNASVCGVCPTKAEATRRKS